MMFMAAENSVALIAGQAPREWSELEYPVGHGDGYVDFISSDPNAYALRCRGDSMAPRIKDEAHGRIAIPVDQVAAMHLVAGIVKRVRWHA